MSCKFSEAEVAKGMRLIPEALKRDFISPIVKAFVRSCIMMIEGMTSSSNLVASWFSFSQIYFATTWFLAGYEVSEDVAD